MPKRIQFSLASMLLVTFAFALWFAFAPSVRTYIAIQRLSNEDVAVDGGYAGLSIQISGEPAAYIESLGPEVNPWLQHALKDSRKFAAAHVLLSRINLNQSTFGGVSKWNQMSVSLYGDGSVDFHEDQIPDLVDYWQQFLPE